jgi:hypothetical protein
LPDFPVVTGRAVLEGLDEGDEAAEDAEAGRTEAIDDKVAVDDISVVAAPTTAVREGIVAVDVDADGEGGATDCTGGAELTAAGGAGAGTPPWLPPTAAKRSVWAPFMKPYLPLSTGRQICVFWADLGLTEWRVISALRVVVAPAEESAYVKDTRGNQRTPSGTSNGAALRRWYSSMYH